MSDQQKTSETTAVIEPLPGEQALDEHLLDQAVHQINAAWAIKGIETAREIGEYVLSTFFDGDPTAFHERGKGHTSFRALSEREDLYVSHSWIWRAVSVTEQLRLLPEDISTALPFTHHTLLIPVKDQKTKVKLAKSAAQQGWSKRKLEAEVKKVRPKRAQGPKVGRPPLPRFQKSIHKIEKLLKEPEESFGDIDQIDALDHAAAQKLYQAVTGMKRQCEALEKALHKQVQDVTADEEG